MKKSIKLVSSLCVALLAVGAGVALSNVSKVEAEAEGTKTIYCKADKGWWYADNAAVGVHYWGGSSSTDWPGVRMNRVGDNTNNVWTFDIPNDSSGCIFTRVNPSGDIAYWNAKTKDLILTDGNDFFTISENAVWGDPGCDGEWSKYATPIYHLVGSFNDWSDPTNSYILTADADDSNHFSISNVSLEANAKLKVKDFENSLFFGNNSSNVVVEESGKYTVDFYFKADNHCHVVLNRNVEYKVKIGTNEYTLSEHMNNELRADFTAVPGEAISQVTANGEPIEFTIKPMGNNNLDSDKKILVGGSQTVYYDTVAKTVFVSGITHGGYHMIKNFGTINSRFVEMTKGDDFEGFKQYYSDSIEFVASDTISFIDTTSITSLGTPFNITKINEGGLSANFEVKEGKIQCKTACSSMVYMKLKAGQDEVYFGDVTEQVAKAIKFANGFINDVTEACNSLEASRAASVKAVWDTKAAEYKAFDDSVKNVLKEGSSSSIEAIRNYSEKYSGIYNRRGEAYNLENFMGWDLASAAPLTGVIFSSANSNISITIVLICSLAAVSVIGGFFYYRKRRHN